jgi:hypothetical protein
LQLLNARNFDEVSDTCNKLVFLYLEGYMPTTPQFLRGYLRRKRILSIEFIRAQGYYCWGKEISSDEWRYGRYGFTPIWPKFIMHLLIWVFLGLCLGAFLNGVKPWLPKEISIIFSLLVGWLSVEINDYIWLRYFKKIQAFVNGAYILVLVLLCGLLLTLVLQGFGEGTLGGYLLNWRAHINQDLQRDTASSIKLAGESKGENWALILDATGQLEPLSATQAIATCPSRFGADWRLPTMPELKMLRPHPVLSKSTRIITTGKGGGLAPSELGASPQESGNTFSSHESDDVYVTLCYRGKP